MVKSFMAKFEKIIDAIKAANRHLFGDTDVAS